MNSNNDFLEDTPNNSSTDKEQIGDSYPDDYDSSLNGIGGWLLFFVIGHFLSMFLWIKIIINYVPNLDIHKYALLSTTIIVFGAISIILSIFILIFIFKRNLLFRILYVVQLSAGFLYVIFLTVYIANLGRNHFTSISNIIGTIVGSIIWILYVYKSKRIKNTFVYPKIYKKPKNDGYRL